MLRKFYSIAPALCLFIALSAQLQAQQGSLISTGTDQKQLLQAFRLVLEKSSDDYRDGTAVWDNELFPAYGEHSIYWIIGGANAGKFVYPGEIPEAYPFVNRSAYSHYSISGQNQRAVQFKKHPKRVAIFKSQYKANETTISWESMYFEQLFSEHLMDDVYYTVSEDSITGKGIDPNTELLIIPAFAAKDSNYTFYIDSIFSVVPSLGTKIKEYTARGGRIYAEGNGVYFLQKAGFLDNGAVDYESGNFGSGLEQVTKTPLADAANYGFNAAAGKLYGSKFPAVNSTRIHTSGTLAGNPCIFYIDPAFTSGSRVLCNTGLPTVHGLTEDGNESLQIGYTLSAILSAFSYEVDFTRKVRNELTGAMATGDNATSYDRSDTISVEVRLRNLHTETISGITVTENISGYFTLLDVTSGDAFTLVGNQLVFSGISLAPHTEKIIVYRVITPDPESAAHEHVDDFIARGTLAAASNGQLAYSYEGFQNIFNKDKNYANLIFSARIFADTDVNWKNFLNLEYQPFKVFMIMENKSRSPALNTVYTQYIPKDVPFYWSDNSINIPILKTPGGKYVDVLKGSNEENNPEYDMDSDGHPDVWLDTASIFPKGYKIVEEEVYWANPWNHLRTGLDNFVFEDIDHDGVVAVDNNGDGIPETEDPDDKIRIWKITWDIGRVEGYEYHDPYCSYEIWVDPPDLVPLAAGVGYAHGTIEDPYPNMFYPYTENIGSANLADTTWSHWMDRDEEGHVIWKQLIHQQINNYEGYTFIDTADANYRPLPTDIVIGTCPQPHQEFIAVLSLGGEEIDMTNYVPQQSLYSKVNYETVFGEERVTPIRTTYTYWAPLPNPLQFEYLSNNYLITDTLGQPLKELPEYGPAKLTFDMDASTEYTYYWIRNFGYDVDFNDPSLDMDGIDDLGDGVFGYFIYEIPKGMGGYRITLPKNEDGSYKTEEIVSIDGQPFTRWIDNPNTLNEVEIWETPFAYQVYIPQLLIPPALDDDGTYDGIDDWIDDRGDRFESTTGYLHDPFMPGNGEDYEAYPAVPFQDDIYGTVNSGWYNGTDGTYGDDFFEDLGKTHIQIHADYEGRGREGTVEISKGGVLVCEEIFGGSPWVIFSHVLSGFARGTDLSIQSEVIPEIIYYGIDTVYLKHVIADTNEPHYFDANFDPYHISYGYGETTITTYVGAKDPCSLVEPAISMPAILDPEFDNHTVTLIPNADPGNPDLSGYPKQSTGTFLEIRVEVNNSTSDNWINTTVTPQLPAGLGNTSLELSYVAYPRPLVPSHYNSASGEIIPGDQPGTFTTGWRFNQPENEVLINMGSTLNLMQPTRRAYFVFLFKIDPSLEKGIYEIPFTMSGFKKHYSGTDHGSVAYAVPNALFCIADKNEAGYVTEFEQIILGQSALKTLDVAATEDFAPTGRIKWSTGDFGRKEFEGITGTLTANGTSIDLSRFTGFPKQDTTQLVILQEGVVDSYNTTAELMRLTDLQTVQYTNLEGEQQAVSERLMVKPVGPRIRIKNKLYSINGVQYADTVIYESEEDLYVETLLTAKNTGSDISSNTVVNIFPGEFYEVVTAELDANCTYSNGMLSVDFGSVIPGEMKEQLLPFVLRPADLPEGIDIRTLIEESEIDYEGTLVDVAFNFTDTNKVTLDLYDFEATSLSFTDLGNGQVQVDATVGNRGIPGKEIWVRIYPIIGGGAYEFPFAEIRVDQFNPLQTVDLSGNYTLPVTDKSIEFIAIVDDGYDYTEITELNNSLRISYVATGVEDPLTSGSELTVYPMPFSDEAYFDYNLEREYGNISLKVFDFSGRLRVELSHCPSAAGSNHLVWRSTGLPAGNYIYKMTGNEGGSEKLLFTGRITKVVR